MWFLQSLIKGKSIFLNLLAAFFLMHPRAVLATFAIRTRCQLMFNLVSTRTSSPFYQSNFYSQSVLSLQENMWLLFPMCRTWHFPSLNFMRILSVYFSTLLRSLCSVAEPSAISNTFQLCIICILRKPSRSCLLYSTQWCCLVFSSHRHQEANCINLLAISFELEVWLLLKLSSVDIFHLTSIS